MPTFTRSSKVMCKYFDPSPKTNEETIGLFDVVKFKKTVGGENKTIIGIVTHLNPSSYVVTELKTAYPRHFNLKNKQITMVDSLPFINGEPLLPWITGEEKHNKKLSSLNLVGRGLHTVLPLDPERNNEVEHYDGTLIPDPEAQSKQDKKLDNWRFHREKFDMMDDDFDEGIPKSENKWLNDIPIEERGEPNAERQQYMKHVKSLTKKARNEFFASRAPNSVYYRTKLTETENAELPESKNAELDKLTQEDFDKMLAMLRNPFRGGYTKKTKRTKKK